MKTKSYIILAGVLALGATAQASVVNVEVTGPDTGTNISVFTGTISSSAVTLYGFDVYSNIPLNTIETGTTTALTGTTNDELAWLATQIMNLSGTHATTNSGNLQTSIDNIAGNANYYNAYHPTSNSGDSGATQADYYWAGDAMADFGSTVAGYATLNTSDWEIVSVTIPGRYQGSTTDTFLAYSATGFTSGVPTKSDVSATPEPASFFLIGSGLIGAGLIGRRRVVKSNS